MKIHITRLHGGAVGGAEQSALLYSKVLYELGHEARLYSNFIEKPVYAKKVWVPSNKLLRWAWSWIYFPLFATFNRADILNPHSREDQITLTLSKWLHRTPVVWKDPGDLAHQIKLERTGILGSLNQKLLIYAIKSADVIYMLNNSDRENVLERLKKLGYQIDEAKFKIIPSDILFEEYSLNAPAPKQTSKLVIGTISRIDNHKGIQYLIKASRKLVESHQNLEFWIVGEGPYRLDLEKQAKGLDITFWGHQDDISPFASRFDIFVQPAEFEGWGRNVKEAMYFGKPVIGSRVGGIASQIDDGKTGLLFEPRNVSELSEKLRLLINDELLRQNLGNAARAKALADGDFIDLMKNKILPLFESVVAKDP